MLPPKFKNGGRRLTTSIIQDTMGIVKWGNEKRSGARPLGEGLMFGGVVVVDGGRRESIPRVRVDLDGGPFLLGACVVNVSEAGAGTKSPRFNIFHTGGDGNASQGRAVGEKTAFNAYYTFLKNKGSEFVALPKGIFANFCHGTG